MRAVAATGQQRDEALSNLTHDIQRKRAEAESLPSVDEWLAKGGEIERPTDAPRPDYTMGTYEPRSRIPLAGVK